MDEFNFRTNWKNNLILVSYSWKPLLDNFGLLFSRIKGYDTIAYYRLEQNKGSVEVALRRTPRSNPLTRDLKSRFIHVIHVTPSK